ncbi:MAG: acetolactate synthase small subunit [Spirochaetaceae bacterium]|nr:acetolactate synthase small subunit [Spirochaetaceae bacterium]MDT8298558.1 acetolactate synthase small subunit [Spirochaetaceae bacterium]
MDQSNKHTISLLVSNKPGVLTRVALVFARRGFNIDSLVVSQSQDQEFSRMNIEATGDERTLHLMLNQLNRLIDVIHAVDHASDDVIQRELALFKINCSPEARTEVLQIADTFRGQTVDISDETITLQVTGKSTKVDAFKQMMSPFGIMELVRTGKVLMSRGLESTA